MRTVIFNRKWIGGKKIMTQPSYISEDGCYLSLEIYNLLVIDETGRHFLIPWFILKNFNVSCDEYANGTERELWVIILILICV